MGRSLPVRTFLSVSPLHVFSGFLPSSKINIPKFQFHPYNEKFNQSQVLFSSLFLQYQIH